MILSKQLFQDKYCIDYDFSYYSLSSYLKKSPFFYFATAGAPVYLPIGLKILQSIESICLDIAVKSGFDYLDIPTLIPSDTLSLGEKIKPGFLDQFVFLKNRLDQYHLLSTPEPYLIHILKNGLESYRQLPMNIVFTSKFFRQLREIDGILKSREFKMLAALSLHENKIDFKTASHDFVMIMNEIQSAFSLKFHPLYDEDKRYYEYFYFHDEGSEFFEEKGAISMAMFYQYACHHKIKSRYRKYSNKCAQPSFITFGLGLQRLFFVILDAVRDSYGFNFSKAIRPFEIMVCSSSPANTMNAEMLYKHMLSEYKNILYDDRAKRTIKEKCRFSDFIGIPIKLIVKKDTCVLETRGEVYKKRFIPINHDRGIDELKTVINKML